MPTQAPTAASAFRKEVGVLPSAAQILSTFGRPADQDHRADLEDLGDCVARRLLATETKGDSKSVELARRVCWNVLYSNRQARIRAGAAVRMTEKQALQILLSFDEGDQRATPSRPIAYLLRRITRTSPNSSQPPSADAALAIIHGAIQRAEGVIIRAPRVIEQVRHVGTVLRQASAGWDHLEPYHRARAVQLAYDIEYELGAVPIMPELHPPAGLAADHPTTNAQELLAFQKPPGMLRVARQQHYVFASLQHSAFDPQPRRDSLDVFKRWD